MLSLPLPPETGARLLARAIRELEFNPDQPRDESGKWTEGGGPADLGESDLPTFDEADDSSPEWKTMIRHDQFLDNLEESEERYVIKMHEALDNYVHAPDELNSALRANPDLLDEADDQDDDEDEDEDDDGTYSRSRSSRVSQIGLQIENAMSEAPKLKEPVTVWRGLNGVMVDQFTGSPQITLNGFQSTSFNSKIAARFLGDKVGGLATGDNPDGVLLKITAKYGLAFGHAHSIDGEMEMLLPHGDRYDVIGVGKVRHAGKLFPVVHLRQR